MVWAEDLRCSFSRLAPLGWDVLTEFPASLSWVDRPLNRLVHAPGSSQGLCVPHICCFSVTQSCATLCDSMDCSMTGFPVHHQLPELAPTHVHRVGDFKQQVMNCGCYSSSPNLRNLFTSLNLNFLVC